MDVPRGVGIPTPSSVVCERVRAQVSLLLDGELSQLERRMLVNHLGRCPECKHVASEMTRFTELLRAAPLEALTRPVSVRRTGRSLAGRAQLGIAAGLVVAFAAVLGPFAGSQSDRPTPARQRTLIHYPTQAQLERELVIIQAGPSLRSGSSRIF